MPRKSLSFLVLATAVFMAASGAMAGGDAKKGKRVFNKCKPCHVIDKATNRIGPHLVGLFGRKAGTVKGYKYSAAMAKSGIVWNEKTIDAYVSNPRKLVPGNKMAFPGLKKEDEREDLIAYLKQQLAK